ncbi:MAG TPA: biotin carboxylase N-terminal domain-containing protein [Myxococcota bacterium]|nr:biotin carboxylase N-terminal domain-containing protein [Myxococcota bacterium]
MRRLLIANRGEIARRVQRTCRAMGIETVAVFSEPDRDAPFVREADLAVALGGATPAESYLRGDAIVDAARRAGADAVHPGYGFLSENAAFAAACRDAGLVFVGPTPEAIAAMGSKLEAKRLLQAAGVPQLPSRTLEPDAPRAAIERLGRELGLPVLVKASAGGGGRGMRVVREAGALAEAVGSASREALSGFGDATVYLERYLEGARHVEVQIFGDAHGRVVHLYERECSIQRRHQKIVEEAPSPALSAALRESICKAAVATGEAIGYRSAGTVEFLLASSGEFFFLEVNTRLQVEHPVTEAVTGLDLVRLQLEIAEGGRLPAQHELPALRGHAIEVRLYAEDPEHGFAPATGRLHRFAIDAAPNVRVDAGVEDGSDVSVHYDPMLAKVIAWADGRDEAADRLAAALARARLHGPRTNRDLLVRVLRHPEFRRGATDTHFLERCGLPALAAPLCDASGERLHAAAAALALQAGRRAAAAVLAGLPSGWRNVPAADQVQELEGAGGARLEVRYRFARKGLHAAVGGEALPALRVHAARPDLVDLEVGGVRRRFAVHAAGERVYVDSDLGASELRLLPRFAEPEAELAAGSLVAPMPGLVTQVCVALGDAVAKGDVLVVLEAMKMEQPIRAPHAGRVAELRAAAGQQVEAGAVLAVIEEEAA